MNKDQTGESYKQIKMETLTLKTYQQIMHKVNTDFGGQSPYVGDYLL